MKRQPKKKIAPQKPGKFSQKEIDQLTKLIDQVKPNGTQSTDHDNAGAYHR